jgi:hypothetical protein
MRTSSVFQASMFAPPLGDGDTEAEGDGDATVTCTGPVTL